MEGYVQDLTNHIQYQQTFPEPGEEIEEDAKTIDIEYVLSDMAAHSLIECLKSRPTILW